MITRYALAEMSAEEFISMAEAIGENESLILPFIKNDPQDELAARRLERTGELPPIELVELIEVLIYQHEPFVVHARIKNWNQLPWVHIQADGDVVSFDVVDFE